MKRIVLLGLAALMTSAVYAQDAEDDFGDFFSTTAAEEEAASTTDDGSSYVWGGSFSSNFTAFALWPGWPTGDNLFDADQTGLNTNLDGELFFNARVSDEFRVNLKLMTAYPFDVETPIKIYEFFSDFQYENLMFFRVGKQNIAWGKGVFFSPADVLNLTPIDPTDTSAEREGPLSLKTSVPIGDNTFYLFLIANNIDTPSKIAIAPKFDWALGANEISFAAFYRSDMAPRAMIMASVPVSDIDFFGEVVLQYGSDKNWVRSTALPPFYEVYERNDEFFALATVGFSFMNTDWNLFASGQYFYNMDGYSDSDDATTAITAFMTEQVALQIDPSYVTKLSVADISMRGQHYAAASVSWSKAFIDDMNLSAFFLGNFSDLSGQTTFSVGYTFFDHASVTGSLAWSFGEAGDEFTPMGETVKASIGFNLGTGSF